MTVWWRNSPAIPRIPSKDAQPEHHWRQAKGRDRQPTGDTEGEYGPGNRRRAANGKVCSKASAYANASIPRGTPLPTSPTKKAVLNPAATNASPLSNNQALGGSRRDPPARSL